MSRDEQRPAHEMGVTAEGQRLVEVWLATERLIDSLKSQLKDAERDLDVAKRELGRWLCPDDARTRETFCVWYGDSLISAYVRQAPCEGLGDHPAGAGEFDITVRTRGRNLP